MTHQEWVAQCVELALENATNGQAPFAALVVQGDHAVGEGLNDVKATQDVAGHAEIRALQSAAQRIGSKRLEGCVLYTSCEPCPMCLGAIYWSGISHVYYGLSVAEQAAFDDLPALQYTEFSRAAHKRRVQLIQATPDTIDPSRPFKYAHSDGE